MVEGYKRDSSPSGNTNRTGHRTAENRALMYSSYISGCGTRRGILFWRPHVHTTYATTFQYTVFPRANGAPLGQRVCLIQTGQLWSCGNAWQASELSFAGDSLLVQSYESMVCLFTVELDLNVETVDLELLRRIGKTARCTTLRMASRLRCTSFRQLQRQRRAVDHRCKTNLDRCPIQHLEEQPDPLIVSTANYVRVKQSKYTIKLCGNTSVVPTSRIEFGSQREPRQP